MVDGSIFDTSVLKLVEKELLEANEEGPTYMWHLLEVWLEEKYDKSESARLWQKNTNCF